MSAFQVTRVAAKLNELYDGIIDLDDVSNCNGKRDAFCSRALAAYALYMNANISIQESSHYITDGYDDNGIDAVYCDNNAKKIYIVQSKWNNNGDSSISQGDVAKYVRGINKLINLDFTKFNQKVMSFQKEISNAMESIEYTISAIIVYTSNQCLSAECRNVLNDLSEKTNDGSNEIFTYHTVLLKDVYNSLANNISSTINIPDLLLSDWGKMEHNEQVLGYYGKLSVSFLGNLWEQHGDRILKNNLRFYKGDTEVNTSISETLKNDPSHFVLFNNGIKIIAKKISRSPIHSTDRTIGLFSLENVSIVNGAQTTGCIGEVVKHNPDFYQNAYVMAQLIDLSSLPDKYDELVTKRSNTQNRIDSKDFASMDKTQQRLSEEFLFDHIKYLYKPGWKQDNLGRDKVCTIDEVAISVGCYLDDISISSIIKCNYGKIYEDLSSTPYTLIFNQALSVYFAWNCVTVFRIFEEINNSEKEKHNSAQKLICIHGNRFLLHMVMGMLKNKLLKSINSNYFSDSLKEDIKSFIQENLPILIENTFSVKTELFPDAYIANVFKNNNRCKLIKEKLIDLLEPNPDNMTHNEQLTLFD